MTATESQTDTAAARRARGPAERLRGSAGRRCRCMPEDPPRVGEFWLRGRLGANAAGYLYTAS